jgi:heme-degrading monooxygenase HmoA
MMVTKVLIKRRFKKDKTKEIVALLNKFRTTAMDCAGYISGETLISNDDPQKMVVISTWESIEAWNRWKNSDTRKNSQAMLEIYQEGPTEFEVYSIGAFSKT